MIDLFFDLVGHALICLISFDEVVRLLEGRHHVAVQLVVPANFHRCHFYALIAVLILHLSIV